MTLSDGRSIQELVASWVASTFHSDTIASHRFASMVTMAALIVLSW